MSTLALTTLLRAPRKFTVDGQEYELYDMDHLTPEKESEALALFARFANIAAELDGTSNTLKGRDLATKLRNTREQIIASMTSLPHSLVSKIPLSQQALLVEAMQEDMEAEAAPETPAGDGE